MVRRAYVVILVQVVSPAVPVQLDNRVIQVQSEPKASRELLDHQVQLDHVVQSVSLEYLDFLVIRVL
jgi:hypothetical protein